MPLLAQVRVPEPKYECQSLRIAGFRDLGYLSSMYGYEDAYKTPTHRNLMAETPPQGANKDDNF